jgi:predicted Holliday junction resolvase-like endonuclease
MSLEHKIIITLFLIIIVLFILLKKTAEKLSETKFQKQSLSTKYGKMSEQFMPFLDNYPYDPQNFRFLGTPIDGIQFEEDKIILMEFKTANSRLSQKQRDIQELVKGKRIYFEEYRLD